MEKHHSRRVGYHFARWRYHRSIRQHRIMRKFCLFWMTKTKCWDESSMWRWKINTFGKQWWLLHPSFKLGNVRHLLSRAFMKAGIRQKDAKSTAVSLWRFATVTKERSRESRIKNGIQMLKHIIHKREQPALGKVKYSAIATVSQKEAQSTAIKRIILTGYYRCLRKGLNKLRLPTSKTKDSGILHALARVIANREAYGFYSLVQNSSLCEAYNELQIVQAENEMHKDQVALLQNIIKTTNDQFYNIVHQLDYMRVSRLDRILNKTRQLLVFEAFECIRIN